MQPHFMPGVGARAPLAGLPQTLAMLLCALAMLAWMPAAFAHASLVSSTPSAGAVLPAAPTDVQLIFNGPVSPLGLKIIQPHGAVIDLTKTHVVPAGLAMPLPALEEWGTYALSWRVVSADGHAVGRDY